MRTEVKHLHLKLGTTSVFVTHDQEEAMTLSDLIAVMRDGKIVQFGPTKEIYRRPRDLYVATFVGKPKMSLVDGTLESADGQVAFVVARPPDRRSGAPDADRPARRRPTRGSRSGSAPRTSGSPRTAAAPAPARSFQATVQLLEPIGSDTFVELADRRRDDRRARRARRRPARSARPSPPSCTAGRIHLFEREHGERIVE